MLTAIYKSSKKEELYLYLTKKDDFSAVPDALLQHFGEPVFVMVINLAKREKLAREDIQNVRAKLDEQGYFLQMPPMINSLLEQP